MEGSTTQTQAPYFTAEEIKTIHKNLVRQSRKITWAKQYMKRAMQNPAEANKMCAYACEQVNESIPWLQDIYTEMEAKIPEEAMAAVEAER